MNDRLNIPHQQNSTRKRNNSLIPPEFIKKDHGETNKECAALATVFGVPEYIESVSFWDNRPTNQDLGQPHAFPSYIDSVLGPIASFDPSLESPTNKKLFALPNIPTVSEFDDILSQTDLGSSMIDDQIHLLESPDIFDYIGFNNDERFIIWGPDPIAISSSLATCRSSVYASLGSRQHERPALESFSSNTTSTIYNNNNSSKSSLISSHSKLSRLSEKSSGLLKKAFKKKESDIPEQPQEEIPLVIEAATIHKLIEKLTSTLDYTFMTDFFLTYRDFIQAQDLCHLLVSRFVWALKDNQESRRIVRIRTFVILRHWLSNYFVHDFLGNYELRSILVDFLNSLSHHPIIKNSALDQRIVKTLKRVIRRLKKLYYTHSTTAQVKIIAPPPPTAEQKEMSERVKASLGRNSRKDHNGNMAIQDAKSARVVVVGSLAVKPNNQPPPQENVSQASFDSLESDVSAGQTDPEDFDDQSAFLEAQEHDEHWLREQKETMEYFNELSRKQKQQTDEPSYLAEPPSRYVSMVAEQLRVDMSHEDIMHTDCACVQCTGEKDATSTCKRINAVFDKDRRQSIESRRRRRASTGTAYGQFDAKSIITNKPPSEYESCSEKSEEEEESESDRSSIHKFMPTPTVKSFVMYFRTSRLASQLCLIERDVLLKVGWEELIHCKWTKMNANGKINEYNNDSQDDLSDADVANIGYTRYLENKRAKGHGVENIIQRFNLMCLWVPSEIVKTTDLADRVKLIEKFIRLAMKCKLYSNYATLVQILLGLQSPSISRLDKTWSKVGVKYQKQLAKLAEFTSPIKNWKHIRDSMTEVAEEYGNSPAEVQIEMPGTTSEKSKKIRIRMPFGGCIPFLGIYLSDLVFNAEKSRHLKPNLDHQRIFSANSTLPGYLNQPLVNFRKYRLIATVIKRVLIFQGLANRYSFEEESFLKNQCKYLQVLDANTVRELGLRMQ